ncbi:glycoside hydrolase family 76 protein [Bacillus sp. FSL K6-3431]|uniref:glycoside hydrolase family 76 protein n=1 Tax=Bacillus sp. FSL K6-3431 TaxID=2921500 RepID=UPI0030FC2EBD
MTKEYWEKYADELQKELIFKFWNDEKAILNAWDNKPYEESQTLMYWWYAHAVDNWVDAFDRTGKEEYKERLTTLIESTKKYNGQTLINNYYDDMEWMALAQLRMYEITKDDYYKNYVIELWEDIKTAWNDHMGGGMAWKKDQLDYKNTPANAPASILGARMYKSFGNVEDLQWSKKIYEFNKAVLVNETGFVEDGINRLGDGKIDSDWKFTYCQGVFIGAATELYEITNEDIYLLDAQKTINATFDQLVDGKTGMLPDEGGDDCGLFKGILVRYLALYYSRYGDEKIKDTLIKNAEVMKKHLDDQPNKIIGTSWEMPQEHSQLATYLSGIMLVEAFASIK